MFPELPSKALKLSINVKVTSALRTISHFTADFGPRFTRDIIPKLSINPCILHIEGEPASAVYRDVEPDTAKHFTAVIRDQYEPNPGECVAVCAALFETGHQGLPEGVSVIEHIFGLNSREKRHEFLDR